MSALALASCGGAVSPLASQAITIDSLLYVAEVFVGDTVTICGTALRPSCDSCFAMTDSAHTAEINIESASAIEIEGGETVIARGQLHEQRITIADIDAKAAEVDSLAKAGAISDDMRQKTINTIEAKKAYMQFRRQDYYSVFSIRGAQVEVE